MTPDFALALSRDLLWTALLVSAPALMLSLLVGLVISVLQVVTQIQEISLTFTPKIITVGLVLIVFGAWMLGVIIQFSTRTIHHIGGL